MDPKPNDKPLEEKGEKNETPEKRRLCEDRGRYWSYKDPSQGMPIVAGSYQKLGEGQRMDSPSEPPALTTPSFGLVAFRTVKTCISAVLNHPGCRNVLWQPQETKTNIDLL